MIRHLTKLMQDEHEDVPNRRRGGRFACEELESSLGDVLDLSVGGVRVRSSHAGALRAGDGIRIEFETDDGQVIAIEATVVRAKRRRWGRGELGLEFRRLDQVTRASILRLATCHAKRDLRDWAA